VSGAAAGSVAALREPGGGALRAAAVVRWRTSWATWHKLLRQTSCSTSNKFRIWDLGFFWCGGGGMVRNDLRVCLAGCVAWSVQDSRGGATSVQAELVRRRTRRRRAARVAFSGAAPVLVGGPGDSSGCQLCDVAQVCLGGKRDQRGHPPQGAVGQRAGASCSPANKVVVVPPPVGCRPGARGSGATLLQLADEDERVQQRSDPDGADAFERVRRTRPQSSGLCRGGKATPPGARRSARSSLGLGASSSELGAGARALPTVGPLASSDGENMS
jgi:hypothetical protein